ncbi:hypothetical protein ACJX0J_024642, partial [Zea mays]
APQSGQRAQAYECKCLVKLWEHKYMADHLDPISSLRNCFQVIEPTSILQRIGWLQRIDIFANDNKRGRGQGHPGPWGTRTLWAHKKWQQGFAVIALALALAVWHGIGLCFPHFAGKTETSLKIKNQ